MRKILKYLEWIPFAIALGSLVIYLVYTIQIKLNPAIIVTDSLINTLKTYLIIALVSLFIGLLIILIKKIRKLIYSDEKIVKETIVKEYKYPKEEKVVITETKKEDVIKVKEETPIETTTIVKEQVEEPIKEEIIKETKIIEKEEPVYKYKVKGVVCPECNNPISENAGICPHCGILFDDEIIKVIKKYEKGKNKRRPFSFVANVLLTILFLILIFLICNMLYNKYNENIKNINYIIQRR